MSPATIRSLPAGPLPTAPAPFANVYKGGVGNDGPYLPKYAEGTLEGTWQDVLDFYEAVRFEVHPKLTFGLTNWTENGRRRKEDHPEIRRVYWDCDDGSPEARDRLLGFFHDLGIPAFAMESSSAKETKWHVEVPLGEVLVVPAKKGREYFCTRFRSAMRFLGEKLGEIAGFEEGEGFDPAPTTVVSVRFPGCKKDKDAPVPAFFGPPAGLDQGLLLFEAAAQLGWVAPEPPQERKRSIVLEKAGLKQKIHFESGGKKLDEAINDRLSVSQFLAQEGHHPKSGNKYYCPVHKEDEDGNLNFHVYPGNEFGGKEVGHCFGDCGGETFPLTKLAASLWGVAYREAQKRLARQVGIDPDDEQWKDRGWIERKQRRRRGGSKYRSREERRQVVPSIYVRGWLKRYVPKLPEACKPLTFARAVAYVLLTQGVDPIMTADTLEVGLKLPHEEVLGVVADVATRLHEKRPTATESTIRKHLGLTALAELGYTLAKVVDKPTPELVAACLGRARWHRGSTGRRFMWSVHRELEKPKDAAEKRKSPRPMLRQACCCGQFASRAKGRVDTPRKEVLGQIVLSCNVPLICVHCGMRRFMDEYEAITGQLEVPEAHKDESREISWEGKGPFHSLKATLPDHEHVDRIMSLVTRFAREPKLKIMGMDDKGRPTLLYVTTSKTAATYVKSAIEGHVVEQQKTNPRYKIAFEREKTHSVKTAAGWAFDQRLSLLLHTERLVFEERTEELLEWLSWAKGRQLVTRSKRGLPWPSRECVRDLLKADDASDGLAENLDGAFDVEWELIFRETDYVIHTQKRNPHTLVQAVSLACISEGFKGHLESLKVEGKRSRLLALAA